MSVTEMLPGWTVAREIPSDVIDGLNRGDYVLHGGVIRSAPSTDGAGQIVRHLLPTGQDLPDSVAASSVFDLTLARTTQDLLHATTGTMLLSGMNLAVTTVGFGVLYKKLTELQKGLSEIKESVDGIVRLLELDERAKLISAFDQLSIVTRKGPGQAVRDRLLHEVLNTLDPARVKYQELLPGARFETAMACQEYFTLASLAVAACWAELGIVDVARDNLERDYQFWVEQARRIAGEDLLGEHPERFMAGEFVPDVSLGELAAWLNFIHDEHQSEPKRIDELRKRILLYADGESRIPIPIFREARAPKETIDADKKKIRELRKLLARNGVFQGYVDQYALLSESGLTPAELQQRIDAVDRTMLVHDYVVLQPA